MANTPENLFSKGQIGHFLITRRISSDRLSDRVDSIYTLLEYDRAAQSDGLLEGFFEGFRLIIINRLDLSLSGFGAFEMSLLKKLFFFEVA